MKLTTSIWLVFALCLLLVLAAMGWLSATALRLDRAEVAARRQTVLEERVRLALWRMDSALAPTVAQESARPYFAYLAYFPADRSFNRMFNSRTKGETLVASPLLVETPPHVLLHFQLDAAGNLTSPQLPPETNKKLDSPLKLDAAVQEARAMQFARLRQFISLAKFADLLPEPKPVELTVVGSLANASDAQRPSASASGMKGEITTPAGKMPQPGPFDAQQAGDALQGAYAPQGGGGQQMPGYGPPQQLPQQAVANSNWAMQSVPGINGSMPGGRSLQMNGTFPNSATAPSHLEPQQLQSQQEFQRRAQTVKQNTDIVAMNEAANLPPGYRQEKSKGPPANYPQKEAPAAPQKSADFDEAAGRSTTAAIAREGERPNTDINGVLMLPLWIDGELVLARRVLVAGQSYVQGCLLDWPEIRGWLKGEIADLLPDAGLVPAGVSDTAEESRLLAALPVRLVPGVVAVDGEKGWSPLMISLSAAWVCLLMTAAAIVGLLWGVIRLSARRASFVTAVTHELRTPLTTFQMYAEMLAEGMVPEESRRKEYLKTLRAEAVRLTHLVENVLAYARLERGRLDRRLETVPLCEMIGAMQGRLADRAAQAGMELTVENGANIGEIMVRTNVSAVEQILFNLVDNACKYASAAEDKRIEVFLREEGGSAHVRVEDHGSGIAPEMRRRLFHSFSKSAKEAAHSAPGVGLGLALSRRLARDLGGDLSYDERHSPGAAFLLMLPLA